MLHALRRQRENRVENLATCKRENRNCGAKVSRFSGDFGNSIVTGFNRRVTSSACTTTFCYDRNEMIRVGQQTIDRSLIDVAR